MSAGLPHRAEPYSMFLRYFFAFLASVVQVSLDLFRKMLVVKVCNPHDFRYLYITNIYNGTYVNYWYLNAEEASVVLSNLEQLDSDL